MPSSPWSRKRKFGQNWRKAKARGQRIHTRIGHVRDDYLHQLSHTISQNSAMVCIEDLPVRNMFRSASGTVEKPGWNVRQKAELNRATLDQGWAEFRRQEENADLVGAINVLRAGHARFACEGSGAARPPAAGTHRSDLRGGSMPRLSAVGISALPAQAVAAGQGRGGCQRQVQPRRARQLALRRRCGDLSYDHGQSRARRQIPQGLQGDPALPARDAASRAVSG